MSKDHLPAPAGFFPADATGFLTVQETHDFDDRKADEAGQPGVSHTEVARYSGEIEASGDEDWLRVTLEAGKTYRIDLEGEATDAGTLYNPRLAGIYDAYGGLTEGTADDDGGVGNNSRVAFTP